MEKLQNRLYWAILLSETSHVFCCVLPTIFSLASLLAGIGMIGALPAGMVRFHEIMHDWELPLIIISGMIIALGWALHEVNRKFDCHDTGCHHGPCGPRKRKADRILRIATALFLFNILIYGVFHRGMGVFLTAETHTEEELHQYHDPDIWSKI